MQTDEDGEEREAANVTVAETDVQEGNTVDVKLDPIIDADIDEEQSTTNATANDNVEVTTDLENVGFFHLPVAIPYWIFYLLQQAHSTVTDRPVTRFNSLLDFLLVATPSTSSVESTSQVSIPYWIFYLLQQGVKIRQ